jgi:hypothetical protein
VLRCGDDLISPVGKAANKKIRDLEIHGQEESISWQMIWWETRVRIATDIRRLVSGRGWESLRQSSLPYRRRLGGGHLGHTLSTEGLFASGRRRAVHLGQIRGGVFGIVPWVPSMITRCIWLLRCQLGDDVNEPRFIETVATVGYRFLCDVEAAEDGFGGLDEAELRHQDIRGNPRS